jgi:hypothetical protein
MTNRDQLTFTLRARRFEVPPIAGDMMAAPKGRTVYRIVDVTSVRTAGDPKSQRFRVICERLNPSEVPEGAVVVPWPSDRRAPRQRRHKALRSRPSADPGPPELAGARLDRIRAKAPVHLAMAAEGIRADRIAEAKAQKARAARVGLGPPASVRMTGSSTVVTTAPASGCGQYARAIIATCCGQPTSRWRKGPTRKFQTKPCVARAETIR